MSPSALVGQSSQANSFAATSSPPSPETIDLQIQLVRRAQENRFALLPVKVPRMSSDLQLSGFVAPGYEAVRAAFDLVLPQHPVRGM